MTEHSRQREDEPVSLAPLTPAEALRALLAVDPNTEVDDENEERTDSGSPTAPGEPHE